MFSIRTNIVAVAIVFTLTGGNYSLYGASAADQAKAIGALSAVAKVALAPK